MLFLVIFTGGFEDTSLHIWDKEKGRIAFMERGHLRQDEWLQGHYWWDRREERVWTGKEEGQPRPFLDVVQVSRQKHINLFNQVLGFLPPPIAS